MWSSQIVVFVLTVCLCGSLCLTRTKRAVLTGDENPYDLREALRVLERERRRLELRTLDPVPQREVRFEQQPVIVDSENDDPDFLARAVAEKGDSVYYSSDQANDVENLLREIEEQKEAENEASEDDLQTVYGHPLSDTEMDVDVDNYPSVVEKRAPVKKAVSGKRVTKKGLDLTAGKRSAQTLKTAFSSLSPEEIHKLLLLEGRLQTKEMNKRQRKSRPLVVETRAQSDSGLEDTMEVEGAAAIPITKEELKKLIQGQEEDDQTEDPNDIDDFNQMNEIIQAESTPAEPSLDQPIDSDIFKSALQDLASLQMLQKQENDGRSKNQEALTQWGPAGMTKVMPVLLRTAPVMAQSRTAPVRVDDGRKMIKGIATKPEPSINLSTTPSLAEMMAKLWIKHKLEGIEIDYLADALNAATMTQSGVSPGVNNIPVEINSLQKAVQIEKLMKELGGNDADIEKDGMLDQLALKYLQRHQLQPEDSGITLSKKSFFDDEIEAEEAAARKEKEEEEESEAAAVARQQEEEEEEEEEYRNNLLRGDDNRQIPLLYEIPDNKINQIPSLPRPDKQNRIPYQLMDIPDDSDAVEDKENDEIPISPDIRLLNTEVNEPDEVENSEEPVETESEAVLSPEEARRLEAEASLRNMLDEVDTEDKLRNQDSNEEETEETLNYQQVKEKCPILEMSRDCQFADMLNIPLNGRKRDLCNRHEMCYHCGTTIGLGASICDRGFLADSIKECNGNLNCIHLADIFLRLMRVTHNFNTMPNNVCNVACVRDYVIGL